MARVALLGSKRIGRVVAERIAGALPAPHEFVGIVTVDDSADARSELGGLAALAEARGVEFHVAAGSASTEEILRGLRPQLVLVAGWYQLIRLERFPETGFFGFHASPLPRYRGNAPLVWQIMEGESEIGLTFFRFAEGMDDGLVVAQELFPLAGDETIAHALERVEEAAARMVEAHVGPLAAGEAPLHEQDHTRATYCAMRVPEDGRIDWSWPARRVHDFVRAQTRPYPGAFTTLPDGRRVRVWRTEVEPRPFLGVPGGVADRGREWVAVSCGEGAVRVLEAEVDGAPPASAREIFNSLRLRLG